MPDPYLSSLIRQGEHQRLDFKFAVNDARKIARSLVAFANTDGGTLLIGVKDNGVIAGVRSEEEIYMLDAAATMYCRPEVRFEVRKWDIDKKSVLEVIVARSKERPHYVKDEDDKYLVYIRVNDQNLLANKVLMMVWEMQKANKPALVRYTDKEEILLHYLEANEQLSISLFCKLANIPRFIAERILVNLIVMKIVKICFTEKGSYYKLVEENAR
jgi:predicted HTH transcriptional regulator